MKTKTLQLYKKLLPQKIAVLVHKEGNGFWAEIKGRGLENCHTQAENFNELIKMVNDAIFDYLEIPLKVRKDLGFYLPCSIINALKEKAIKRRGQLILKYINDQTKVKREVAFTLA
ncbi:hypothetical protein KJ562_02420 [Patescibacteria group bacterium]|nr:hypothetical protein [Patescibacteria group bacterium]MBU4162324.1 hypothetical protein [Patescibacteria group bacterium]